MNIYVGNLPFKLTADELRQEFTPFGKVLSVTIMNDQYPGSGQMRRYGFVEMFSKSEGNAAVNSMRGKIIQGRVINVVEALPLSNSGFLRDREQRATRGDVVHEAIKEEAGTK